MDTPHFCVYNLARRVFLSSKVTVADAVNQPLKVLKDLVALEGGTALWLTTVIGKPSLPKLFPYDVAYLDKDMRVLDTIEIFPGVDFPAYRKDVASAVVLPPNTLRNSQTRVGDHLVVDRKEEVDRVIAGADHPARDAEAGIGRMPGLAGERGGGGSPQPAGQREPETIVSTVVCPEGVPLATEPTAAPRASFSAETKKQTGTADAVKAPTVSITEVVIEKPHDFEHQAPSNVEHRGGLEDLFANWVDSPSAPPSWIAQKAREREAEALSANGDTISKEVSEVETPEADHVSAPAASPEVEPAQAALDATSADDSSSPATTPAGDDLKEPAANVPVAIKTPQRPQTNTFTIGQYGIWQLSTPTAISPKRPVPNGAGQTSAKDSAQRTEGAKPQNQGATRRTGEARTSLPVRPKQAPTSAPPAKPAVATENGSAGAMGRAKPETSAEKAPVVQPDAKKPDVAATPVASANDVVSPKVESAPITPAGKAVSAAENRVNRWTKSKSEPVVEKKIERVSAKPTPAEFVSTIQARLEKLQTAGALPSQGTEPEKKPSAARPQPTLHAQAAPTIPEKPAAKPGTPNSGSSPSAESPAGIPKPAVNTGPASPIPAQTSTKPAESNAVKEPDEIAVTLPLPRFLKPKPEQKEKLKISISRVETTGRNAPQPDGFGARLRRWLSPPTSTKNDRRRAHRRYVPGMVAHYYTGGAPIPHDVADISMSGFYLLTQDRWVPETMIQMTLQKPCAKGERKQSISVLARVVRRGTDGVGAEFVMQESLPSNSRDILPSQATDRFLLARFL